MGLTGVGERRGRALAALIAVSAFACAEALDCSGVSCVLPHVTVETTGGQPAGSRAELCGDHACITVPLGTPTQPPTMGFTEGPGRIDRRFFGKDRWQGTTRVRILGPGGEVLAQGVGEVEQEVACCGDWRVSFDPGR